MLSMIGNAIKLRIPTFDFDFLGNTLLKVAQQGVRSHVG